MTRARADLPLGPIQALWDAGSFAGRSDAELLARFLATRDPAAEAAFAALVCRHGPMVLKVCRQLLGDEHIVEDAFQATFLVLARKARSLRHPEALGRWLYGAAVRAARKARSIEHREARRARRLDPGNLERAAGEDRPPDVGLIRRETNERLHRELGRLPEKYRAPVILCHLEGLTHEEAARRLGWPVGTVGVRLMRARELLRQRLVRRGVAPAAAVPAAFWADSATAATVPAGLIEATARSVMQMVIARSPAAAAAPLTKAVLRGLGLARLRAIASLLAAVVVGVAAGVSGAHWLSPDPERELEARALELALRLQPVAEARHLPRSAPPVPAPSRDRSPRDDPRYTPAQGYEWVFFRHDLPPADLREDRAYVEQIGIQQPDVSGLVCLDQDQSGETVLTIGRSAAPDCERLLDYRPVLFDAQKRRYLPRAERRTHATSEFGGEVVIDRFRLGRDHIPFEAIHSYGVERMRPQTRRLAAGHEDAAPFPIVSSGPDSFPADRRGASPGCSWILAPRPVGQGDWTAAGSGPGGGVACNVSTNRAGILAINLAYRSLTAINGTDNTVQEYRPILFDAAGHHHLLEASSHSLKSFGFPRPKLPSDWSHTAVFRFEVRPDRRPNRSRDRLSPADVAYIGVERLSPRTLRDACIASFMASMRRDEDRLDLSEKKGRSELRYALAYTIKSTGWPGAQLGAYEILRAQLGQPGTTPESLREVRIAQFVVAMRRLEQDWGPLFAKMVETPYFEAYEIFRHQSAGPR
jgi:RNA polymerase sigma factor (sigma-70 family)